jgi:hypothetical protein
MVNKPGALAQVLGEFARAKMNIVAITMMDSVEHGVMRVIFNNTEHGVMRVIFNNTEKARDMIPKLNMPFHETEVLCVTLTNKAGALAALAEKLAKEHVNISYAYCTAGAKGGKTTGVLKVADVKKAMKVLKPKASKGGKSRPVIRRRKKA